MNKGEQCWSCYETVKSDIKADGMVFCKMSCLTDWLTAVGEKMAVPGPNTATKDMEEEVFMCNEEQMCALADEQEKKIEVD